ncbi:MAG: class I SAM-dependent methyltransferase [Bacteroidia bacterium]|nr:class I SAM-dependent methyltransferase [Bacteroidia bacterium]
MAQLHTNIESVHYDEKVSKIGDLLFYYHSLTNSYKEGILRKSHKRWTSLVAAEMKSRGRGIILDYGCGTGIHSVGLANENWFVHGIDISGRSVDIALSLSRRLNTSLHTEYKVMNCQELLFPDNSFDIILDYGTFSSLDIKFAIPELIRVLKPEGSVICIETYGHNPFANFKRWLNVLSGKRTKWAASHIMRTSDWQIISGKFKESEIFYYGFFVLFCNVFLKIFPGKLFESLLTVAEKTDAVFLKNKILRKWAFKTIVVLKNPVK